MDLDQLQYLGTLGKPWGHKGQLTMQLEGVYAEDIADMRALFAEVDGQKVPFFFSDVQEKGRETLVKFEGYDDPQAARFLVGCAIYAPPGHEVELEEEEWGPEDCIGMRVLDEEHGLLGEVEGLEGTETHPVLVVRHGDQEVLIPMVDDIILGMDAEENALVVRTPPGLVELYRGEA